MAEADVSVRWYIGLASVIVIFSSVMTAVSPVLLKYAVDALGNVAAGHELTPIWFVVAYILCLGGAKLIGELKWIVYGRADQRLQRRLTVRLFDHLLRLPVRFHRDRQTGGIMQIVHNGVLGYRIILQHSIFTFLSVILQVGMMAVVFVHFFEPTILLILGAAFCAYAIAFVAGVARVEAPSRSASGAEVDAAALMADHLLNYEAVKYFAAERPVRDRVDRAFARTERAWRRFYGRRSVDGLIVALIFVLSFAAVMIFAASQVAAGRMTVGDFVLVNAYLLQLALPLETIGFAVRDMAQGVVFLERLIALLREVPEDQPASDVEVAIGGPGELVFDKVTFGYEPGRRVLNGVSFRAPPGKTIAIVGPTGAGKSTLVQLLLRFETPQSGSILLDGVSLAELSPKAVRRAVAVVPQHTPLFNETVGYNIGFGNMGSDPAAVQAAARVAKIHDQVASWPNGYDTIVGEHGLKLSGGERQRVAIARAALRKPRVLVFDEATSALDSTTEGEILRNLIEISKGVTTVIVAHRLSTVVHADLIFVLDHGEITEQGTHESLLDQNGRYADMWQQQQSGHVSTLLSARRIRSALTDRH